MHNRVNLSVHRTEAGTTGLGGLSTNPPKQESMCRRGLVRFGKMLHRQGFVSGTDGNLSVRLDADRLLVTPSGMSKAMMKSEHMVMVSPDGRKLSSALNPSSELPMHLAIYRLRPEVNAIVHAHPCFATGFASAGIALDEPLCSEIVMSLGKVSLAPYANPGTQEMCEVLVLLIKEHDAVLMSNHGGRYLRRESAGGISKDGKRGALRADCHGGQAIRTTPVVGP